MQSITDAFFALSEFHADFDTSDGHVGDDVFAFSGTFAPRPTLAPILYKIEFDGVWARVQDQFF